MSQQNRTSTQTKQAAARTRPKQAARPPVASRQSPELKTQNSKLKTPIEGHRLMAALALVLLMVLSLLGTRPPSAPDLGTLVTPTIRGANTVPFGMTDNEVQESVFRYLTVVQRNRNAQTPENLADVLRYDPNSRVVRSLLVGQVYASSSGGIDITMVDTGIFLRPEVLPDVEAAYQNMMGDSSRAARGVNGLGAVALFRSLDATGVERAQLERTAIMAFQQAVQADAKTWQFTYNWALANMVAGNYASAYEGMKGVKEDAGNADNKLVGFWMGLAMLRLGEPGEALVAFNDVINSEAPSGSNEAMQNLYTQAKRLAFEGQADALWANRDPAAAYDSYYGLASDRVYYEELIPKWERLGLAQRAPERLAQDLENLRVQAGYGDNPRIHHDRARLLTFLGRPSEAEPEYKEALRLDPNDPSLLISYGQALENSGDHNGALVQAEAALRGLFLDPGTADLTGVARVAATTTTSLLDNYNAQQTLDAYLFRARRAWGASGQTANVSTLVTGITQPAGGLPNDQAGLLYLYAGYTAEAGGLANEAAEQYRASWDKLGSLPEGTTGRAAALAGWARALAHAGKPEESLQTLIDNGYDPTAPKANVANDPDAPDIIFQGALILEQLQRGADAAEAARIATVAQNVQSVRALTGFGRPVWYSTGISTPSNALLYAANGRRESDTPGNGLTEMRYRESYLLNPAQVAAWNNLGVYYAQSGDNDLGQFYLSAAGKVSPYYALGRHNEAALEYKKGIGNFFNAEAAQAAAIKSVGAQSLNWGYHLTYDANGPFPAPTEYGSDWLPRLAAIIMLLLLLAHTLVGRDRALKSGGLQPTRGVLGRLAASLDNRAKGLIRPISGTRGLTVAVLVPAIIGMLGFAWLSGRGSWEVALVFLPAALLAALLAFGGNELAQYIAAGRANGQTLHHLWPLGLLLGVLSILLGFVYGWQAVTRVQPATGEAQDGRKARTEEDLDLAYEAQIEAAADQEPGVGSRESVADPRLLSQAPLGLTTASRILFAGLLINLVVGLLFGLAYWLTAWPSIRLGMFASILVLVFTAVSEPPADGWTLYRRNPALWLAIFVFAATMATLLAANLI